MKVAPLITVALVICIAFPGPIQAKSRQWSGIQSKVWTDKQCKNIGMHYRRLDDCKIKCLDTPTCTAINYRKTDNRCILRRCKQPVQSPQWQLNNWNGYYILESNESRQWSGIQSKVWTDKQCKNIGMYYRQLEDCKIKCLDTPTCTAINYRKTDNRCILRRCKEPVQSPQWQLDNWNGYYILESNVCNSTSNSVTTMGTCLTQQQCSTAGGSSLGTCASGFGVCCKTTKNSGTLNSKVGYVENTGYPSTTTTAETTTINIEVTDSDVCQIRLDFDFFEMDKPATLTTGDTCTTESLAVTSTLFTPNNLGVQPLCGNNTGQHMYIGDFDLTSTPTIVATLVATSTTNPSKWSIKVTQVDCKATDAFSQNIRAPSNCRQYFTSDTGTMTSYNYGADSTSFYSSNQDYQYCVKRNPTDCQIKYVRTSGLPAGQTSVGSQSYPNIRATAVTDAATCFATANAGAPNYANACGSGSASAGCVYNGLRQSVEDYLSIPSAIYIGGSNTYYIQDFFCGSGVGWSSGTTDAGTGVVSQAGGPFSIRFHAGNDLPENCNTAGQGCRLGFSLDYTKAKTCETLTPSGTLAST